MPLRLLGRVRLRVAAILCCAVFAGCASWQGPRIDPSGEQLLIWPGQAPTTVVAPPPGVPVTVAPPPGSPFVTTPAVPAVPPPPPVVPFGNVQAPPVYSDPAPPQPAVIVPPAVAPTIPMGNVIPSPPVAPTLPPPPVMTAPVAATVPAGPGLVQAQVPPGADFLRITPPGVIMPVCREVVLKANICGANGCQLQNERIEWTLNRYGAGQFGDPNSMQQGFGFTHWPWDTPQRFDNWTAVSNTARAQTTLKRAAPDLDVPIESGDAWITVTSATEGTTVVSAHAPGLQNYNRVTSTIYWVDAQWLLPPSAVVESGRPHVLTTTVLRSNGTPVAGWLVRYNVAGGASLGYEGGNTVEVPTDAAGRASVEVSPANTGGGTANVGITIIRPQTGGGLVTPRLEIGRGNATVSWTGGASAGAGPSYSTPMIPGTTTTPETFSTPIIPPSSISGPPPISSPPSGISPPPPMSVPSNISPPPPLSNSPSPSSPPPAAREPAGKPELQLQLRRTSPEQVGVGEFASFEVIITNRGTGTARNVLIQDRFDRGLRHPKDQLNESAVKYPLDRALPPGESASVPLTFQVVGAGIQCHEVTVTAEGAQPVKERGCVTATAALLDVSVTGPRSRVVGETAPFNIVVKNNGTVAATNVELVIRCDPALIPTEIKATHKRLPDGGILVSIDRLEAGERRPIPMWAQCQSPSNNACTQAVITADGGITAAADACVEILPPATTSPRP